MRLLLAFDGKAKMTVLRRDLMPCFIEKWGFRRNHLYFYFWLCHSFTWKLYETGGIVFWLFCIKNETGWWFHDFKEHKIMKPLFGRFHNFSPLKIMKPQPVSFLSQNNRKQNASFIKFHVKLGTKNKESV